MNAVLRPGPSWFVRPREKPAAALRLFCFPHAGGAASAYHRWGGLLQAEVVAVQLPGREGRMNERPMDDLDAVVGAVVDALHGERLGIDDRPFAFFGHSMGSLLAYAAIVEMQRRGMPVPAVLMVSGRAPPTHVPAEPPLHPLPDAAFIDELDRRFGGVPAILREEPELLALFLPVLRADLTMLECHVPRQHPAITVPIRAFGGADDMRARREWLQGWSEFTSDWRGVRQFPGGHFYLHDAGSRLPEAIDAELAALLAPAG